METNKKVTIKVRNNISPFFPISYTRTKEGYTFDMDKLASIKSLKIIPYNIMSYDDVDALNQLLPYMPDLKNVFIKISDCQDKDAAFLMHFEDSPLFCDDKYKIKVELNHVSGLKNTFKPFFPPIKGLTDLTIKNNMDLESISLSDEDFPNLETMVVTNNPKLRVLSPVVYQPFNKLTSFYFYGNKSFENEQRLAYTIWERCSSSNTNLTDVKLDVAYYKYFYNMLPREEITDDCIPFLATKWCELVFPHGENARKMNNGLISWELQPLEYDSNLMKRFHERCLDIVNTYVFPDDTDIEKLAACSRWMWENVVYDEKGLDDPRRYDYVDGHIIGTPMGTNGSINGILWGTCVCQGYTRSLKYLLDLVGIKTKDVHCEIYEPVSLEDDGKGYYHVFSKDDGNKIKMRHTGNHSITQGIINYEGQNYNFFMDNTWDAGTYQKNPTLHGRSLSAPYFLVSYSSLEKSRVFPKDSISFSGKTDTALKCLTISSSQKDKLFSLMEERFANVKESGNNIVPYGRK